MKKISQKCEMRSRSANLMWDSNSPQNFEFLSNFLGKFGPLGRRSAQKSHWNLRGFFFLFTLPSQRGFFSSHHQLYFRQFGVLLGRWILRPTGEKRTNPRKMLKNSILGVPQRRTFALKPILCEPLELNLISLAPAPSWCCWPFRCGFRTPLYNAHHVKGCPWGSGMRSWGSKSGILIDPSLLRYASDGTQNYVMWSRKWF